MISYKVNLRSFQRFTTLFIQSQRYSSVVESKYNTLYDKNLNKSNKTNLEINDLASFPPILDKLESGILQRKRAGWHNKIKRLGVVEEKIFELNMPKYYGWKTNHIEEGTLPYDPLPQAQYVTRTTLLGEDLPDYYDKVINEDQLNQFVKDIQSQVEDALIFEYYYRIRDNEYNISQLKNKRFMDDLMGKIISQQIHRILISNLTPQYKYLLESQTDIEPRLEAFWFFGGFERPYEYKFRKDKDRTDPINQAIKYNGAPILHLRHHLPLKEIVSLEELKNYELNCPVVPLDFRKMGYMQSRERATIIPGFWPGDFNEFGVLSYNNIGHITDRSIGYNDHTDAITAQAIFASFSWLYTQACYQGFSTFQDPTYPFVNQTILTNGKLWHFCVYQLNTTTMHIDCIDTNPKRNLCWMTKPMNLFEHIEEGKIIGFNDEVLKCLIKFYANEPQAKNICMKPYLNKEKLIANIEDPERRIWLEKQYKFLMSNRERHFLTPEIYQYQKLFYRRNGRVLYEHKNFNWQRYHNVYSRRLDQHTPTYIPKVLRPIRKVKYAKTFYPVVGKRKLVLNKNPRFKWYS